MNKMKPALTGLVMLLLCTTLSAQLNRAMDVVLPDPVVDQLTLLYPDANAVTWVAQKGKYLAEFKYEKKNVAALFKKDGQVVQIKTEINVIALPPDATTFLRQEVGCKRIENACIIEEEPGIITFTAKADSEEYRFDNMGRPLSSSNEQALVGLINNQ